MRDEAVHSHRGREWTRRQFLTYALGGTGAFIGASILAPLVTFSLDPLRRSTGSRFVEVGSIGEFNQDLPKQIHFKVAQADGWIQGEATMTAWVILKGQEVLAMSPRCTHLGCQVNGTVDAAGNPVPSTDGQWWFHCPCHGGRYTKYGINDPTTPPQRPLDVYEVKVDNGKVLLGPIHQRTV
ncbi:Rieske (2Fe-2S) protein [Kyrpidia spormannii]|uniref:Menaquinol:cytochrome c oxidoreductase (Iron-sulfur subunit) n=2 Tax=Kyrpidia spormannii TaxID=2055160 RepID=A0A2K8N7R5_9BACL|nr:MULTISPECIES: ubiquinol-cytochrome c reductase iron-sulfur subunit [Kyrpidia]HHY66053.1 ubiquinol-cytochrome c reductase iron-sulfur subunit [Alicyclobacillus sp.]ATY84857.1 Rieske (2Fe-2S) protein [Kyrpidia spormannii]MCL6574576.1 ubiquinol-cytochrome c reductase iron-sulfur subunit [Kyrpidia sp.]CAB3392110.1 menaquinol:cytochrome c oxidoreductase (iron-sulfur subunit) [Kyrpidia spormannii]CAB3393030.1 menaquinol:cytochrome c oxidoreductase (iron-sulfur subunit) [Kyrpidia spormannii]